VKERRDTDCYCRSERRRSEYLGIERFTPGARTTKRRTMAESRHEQDGAQPDDDRQDADDHTQDRDGAVSVPRLRIDWIVRIDHAAWLHSAVGAGSGDHPQTRWGNPQAGDRLGVP
jgi:hypothetical protein